jgi:hypothetical protein
MTTEEPFPRADALALLGAVAYSDGPDELEAGSDEILTIHYNDGSQRDHQFSFEEAQTIKRQLPKR